MVASARSLGIPARVGHADVRNHLGTERLLALPGSDVFIYHGYAELWTSERWVKATPCFNLSLCERFDVAPLEFDGVNDALLHPFDTRQRKYVEYVRPRGVYDDVPFDESIAEMRQFYPVLFKSGSAGTVGDFESEAGARLPP